MVRGSLRDIARKIQNTLESVAIGVSSFWTATDWSDFHTSLMITIAITMSAIWHLCVSFRYTLLVIGCVTFFAMTTPFDYLIRFGVGMASYVKSSQSKVKRTNLPFKIECADMEMYNMQQRLKNKGLVTPAA